MARPPSSQPAAWSTKLTPAEDGRLQGVGRLVRRLRVGELRRGERSARPERHAQAPREVGHDVEDERRLRRAERRRAGLHRHRRREGPEHHRARRACTSCTNVMPGQRLGQGLGGDAGRGRRGHRAGEDERRDEAGLVVRRVDLGGRQHRRVPHERRRGVDEARHDRAAGRGRRRSAMRARSTESCAAAPGGDRAHERLVAVAEVRVHHVEVALVDGHVDRLAHRAARVVQVGRGVGQLHEVLEVGQRGVAAAAVEVVDERRAVVRRQHRGVAADLDVARRVAGVLRVDGGRLLGDDRPAHATREAHPVPVDVGARRRPGSPAPPGSRGR